MMLRAITSLLIVCLPELSMTEKEVLVSPNVLVDLSVSLCTPISFWLIHFDTQLFGSYTFRIVISPWIVDLLILYVIFLFISDSFSGSEVTLFEVNVATPAFFWLVLVWCTFPHWLNQPLRPCQASSHGQVGPSCWGQKAQQRAVETECGLVQCAPEMNVCFSAVEWNWLHAHIFTLETTLVSII